MFLGDSGGAPKSMRKKRQSSESERNEFFDHGHDDFESYSTPKSDRRRTISHFKTPTTQKKTDLLAIKNTPHIEVVVSTPKTPNSSRSGQKRDLGKVMVKKNQIKKQLNHSLLENQLSKNDLKKIARDVQVKENEKLSIVVIPENNAFDSPDLLMRLKSRRSTLVIKGRDDN